MLVRGSVAGSNLVCPCCAGLKWQYGVKKASAINLLEPDHKYLHSNAKKGQH